MLPQQIADEEKALQAKEQDFYDNRIMADARSRGLGFSGIPFSERAKYAATEFLPAIARAKQSGREQALTLEDAISQIRERQRAAAQDMYQFNRNYSLQARSQAEQRRQFNEQLKLQKAQVAAAQRAAAAAAAPTLNTGGGSGVASTNPLQQSAYNEVYTRFNQQTDQELMSDFQATLTSANYGNKRDKFKIAVYKSLRPDLFKRYKVTGSNSVKLPAGLSAIGPAPGLSGINLQGIKFNTNGVRL